MRFPFLIVLAVACGSAAGSAPARADHEPGLAVPGNPSMPVIVNGIDVSYGVIESDWGLYRPGHAAPVAYYPYLPHVAHWYARPYFPVTGKAPRAGRLEVIPPANRRLPPRAPGFHRSWSTSSELVPAQIDYPAFAPPPVILAPTVRP